MRDAELDASIEKWFTYHSPTDIDIRKYERIRKAARCLAYIIAENAPSCADRTTALRKLRECVTTVNVSIACEGK